MKQFCITPSKDTYKVTTAVAEFSFPKTDTTSQIFSLLLPLIEKEQVKNEKICLQLLLQYKQSIQMATLIRKWHDDFQDDGIDLFGKDLEEMMQLTIDWNTYLQDLLRLYEMDVPGNFYDE